jgi:hypothetical protein
MGGRWNNDGFKWFQKQAVSCLEFCHHFGVNGWLNISNQLHKVSAGIIIN